jgi:hypothetical protein
MLEGFDKMLMVIQRYFTHEGIFNMVYQYHIRFLLHFTGKEAMNLPFYLFRSIGKMADRVQDKYKKVDTSVFHYGLIKMLVMEELRKTNTDWKTFLTTSHFQLKVSRTPQSKMKIPTPLDKTVCSEVIKKKRGTSMNDTDNRATNETKERGPSQPSHREVSPMANPIPMEVPSRKSTGMRGRKLMFPSPIVEDKINPMRPFTRVATKQTVPVKSDVAETSSQRKGKYKGHEQPIEIIDITTPQEESNPTFKRLKRQLKEARDEVDKLKSEDFGYRKKLNGMMGMYHETIEKSIFIAKIFLPLHR